MLLPILKPAPPNDMKTRYLLLFALGLGPWALDSSAADAYFGTKAAVTSLHATTNYFIVVLGDGTNSVIRKISPDSLWASAAMTLGNDLTISPAVLGTAAGAIRLAGTNGVQGVKISAVPNLSVSVTNIVGLLHKAAASVIEIDANSAHSVSVTSRVSAATSIVMTNTADGQELNVTVLGEASGGTSRVVTVIPHTGQLAANLDDYSVALAANVSFTLTNGNAVEISDKVDRINGTNVHKIVTRQFKF